MLPSTFCHLSGIGTGTERRLWEEGYLGWDELARADHARLHLPHTPSLVGDLARTREEFACGNWEYFRQGLRSTEYWRLFPYVRARTAYFDIETTDLGRSDTHITTIALYDGVCIQHFVYGENLDDFPAALSRYQAIVTYSGKCFDVPFVEKYFGITVPHFHLDLRYVLASLGYKGGLKGAEKALGISRGGLDGVDGFFAVLLWKEYNRTGNRRALETLLAYNIEDVVNLEKLACIAYNLKLRQTPVAPRYSLCEESAPHCRLPFTADEDILMRLARRVGRRLGRAECDEYPST